MGLDLPDLPDQFLYIALGLVNHPLRRLFRDLEWVFDVPGCHCFALNQVFGPGILLRLNHHPVGCIHQLRRELGLNPCQMFAPFSVIMFIKVGFSSGSP